MGRLHATDLQAIQIENYMGRSRYYKYHIPLSSRQIIRISVSLQLPSGSLYVYERVP